MDNVVYVIVKNYIIIIIIIITAGPRGHVV